MIQTIASPLLSRAPRFRRLLAAAALLGLCTCGINVDVPVDASASIPKATVIDQLLGAVAFTGFDKIDLTAEFKNQGITKDQVNAVNLKSMKLAIDAPKAETFDFLESVSFFAEADGLPKVKIASLPQVPKGATEIELSVESSVDLTPYVVAPSMQITSDVQGSRPPEDTTASAHVVLAVEAHVPGC